MPIPADSLTKDQILNRLREKLKHLEGRLAYFKIEPNEPLPVRKLRNNMKYELESTRRRLAALEGSGG